MASDEQASPPAPRLPFSRLIRPSSQVRDLDGRHRAQLLAVCALITSVVLAVILIAIIFIKANTFSILLPLFVLTGLSLAAYFFSRTRFYYLGSALLTIALAGAGYWLILDGNDPIQSLLSTIPMALILGSVLLPFWGMATLTGVVVLASFFVNLISPGIDQRTIIIIAGSLLTIGAGFLVAVNFRNTIDKLRIKEYEKTGQELKSSRNALEQQVAGITLSLDRRNYIFQAIIDLVRGINTSMDEQQLITQSSLLLAEELKLDHVGIFLLDDTREHLVLCASNSPMGKSLISNRYQLRVSLGEFGRIFTEADILRFQSGNASYHVSQPLALPDMKVNISVPLISGNSFLGLLNIQASTFISDIMEKDVLQLFADRIALALHNIHLQSQLQSRITEISDLAGETIKRSWDRILGGKNLGFYYDRLRIMKADETLSDEIVGELVSGHSVTFVTEEDNPRSRLITPIVLHDEVIGIIGYEDEDPHHEWQDEEKILLETIASRVSLALENTRLLIEAQHRADREQIVSQFGSRIRETLDIDAVLQTAVQEMRQSLGLDQAEIRLQIGADESGENS